MAAKKKPTKRPEVHITIRGPQGTLKTRLAEAIGEFVGGTVDGYDYRGIPDHAMHGASSEFIRRGDEVLAALASMKKRRPYALEGTKIIITTSNE